MFGIIPTILKNLRHPLVLCVAYRNAVGNLLAPTENYCRTMPQSACLDDQVGYSCLLYSLKRLLLFFGYQLFLR